MRFSTACLLLLLVSLSHAQQYYLQSSFFAPTFFDNFDFWTASDPTYGYVHYVDQMTAEQHGMISTGNNTRWGVDTTQVLDPMANLGRLSIRLTSVQSWTHGLFVLDLAHMPANQCGVWPAFWMLGSGTWPDNGEIDIIEFTNNLPNNLMALHTSEGPNCTIAGSGQTGTLLTDDCSSAGGYTGCGVSTTTPNNIGANFNLASGGVYAMEWTSTAIQIWFFPRHQIPASITEANGTTGPDPNTFGVPVANFQGSCDIDSHFFNHSMVFDTTFCGSYAGNTWGGDGCPLIDPTNGWQSCDDFVAANPHAFDDAYWEVNYLNVYQTAAAQATTSSSSLSSVTPAVGNSSVSTALSAAQGRSTTPSGTPSPVTTAPTSAPASSLLGVSTSNLPATSASRLVSESSAATSPYTTTVVIVVQTVTAGSEMALTLSPQIGEADQQPMSAASQQLHLPRQVVEAGTTYWPEPYPTSYCQANPTACDGPVIKRDAIDPLYEDDPIGYRNRRHDQRLPATLPLFNSVSPRAVDELPSATTTVELLPIMPIPGPGGVLLEPDSHETASYGSDIFESDLPNNDFKRDPGLTSILPGGNVNYCGVPGEFCSGHRKFEEAVVPLRIDPPHTESSMRTLMMPTPLATHHPVHSAPSQPPPSIPYVGPSGIVYEPSRPDKRDFFPQTLQGGSSNYCGVPGSFCSGRTVADEKAPIETHEARLKPKPGLVSNACLNPDAVNTVYQRGAEVPTTITTVPRVRQIGRKAQITKVPHTESSMSYLMEPPDVPYVGPNGIVYEPGAGGGPTGCKRDVHAQEILTDLKVPKTESSMLYLMGPPEMTTYWIDGQPFTPPPYTPTFFYYNPLTKRDVDAIKPTPVPDAISSSIRGEIVRDSSIVDERARYAMENIWARQEPSIYETVVTTLTVIESLPPYTPTTFSYDPLTERDELMQPTLSADSYRKDGPIKASTTSGHHGHISSVTCTPVVLVGQDGVPSATGCLPPVNVKITKSEPIIIADTTRTATIPTGNVPRVTDPDLSSDGLIDEVANSAADSVVAKTWTAVMAVTTFAAVATLFATLL